MPSFKFEITNPEAIAIIEKWKSGFYTNLVKQKLFQYRFYLIGTGFVFLIIIGLLIARSLSVRTSAPIYTPPKLSAPTPTEEVVTKSRFDKLRTDIKEFNTSLPDPAIPALENNINLLPELR